MAAAAEERFTGEKTTGAFPVNAIEFCLRQAGIDMADVDHVAHGFDYRRSEVDDASDYTRGRFHEVYSSEVQRAQLEKHWPDVDWASRFVPVPHHMAHAASAFHLSGFDEALILVADGMGETESLTVAVGTGRDMEIVHQVPALHSLGAFYGAATLHLGFEYAMDEYKVMGLAPYGDRDRYAGRLGELVRLGAKGTYTIPLLGENRGWREHETQAGALRELTRLFGPPRLPGRPLEQRHMDMAAAVQTALEMTLTHILRHFAEETGRRRLCMAGGVALNCTANGLISRSRLFDDIFVQPAAGDDGSALGAALLVHQERAAADIRGRMTMPYWGPEFTADEISTLLKETPQCRARRYEEQPKLIADVARLLADGDVVAWFQGRMEFGPRALGNRSILADPRDPGMRDRLNTLVKQREDFRPFAPVVREEDVHRFFEVVDGSPARYAHMLFVVRTKEEYREALPAVTHVDGTARVQVVRRADNERLWELIGAFGELTGIPVLLNTSFNLRGQPVICDPAEALRTYLRSQLDHLVLGDNLVARLDAPARQDKDADR
ncbi:carbamoyltransferase [Streptomyces sp. NPDC059467]|uniref:carbamoyltransferase family protein n=1 Tax=Streptomyces sp. NPDC059467 TaxID=3346844 RepID=UPI0036AD9D84